MVLRGSGWVLLCFLLSPTPTVKFVMPKSMVGSPCCGGYTIVLHKHPIVEKWEVQATGPLVGSYPDGNCQCWEVNYAARKDCYGQ